MLRAVLWSHLRHPSPDCFVADVDLSRVRDSGPSRAGSVSLRHIDSAGAPRHGRGFDLRRRAEASGHQSVPMAYPHAAAAGSSNRWEASYYDESEDFSVDGEDLEAVMTEVEQVAYRRRPRVECLNIESDYADSWTARDGIRELVQNWWDGCIQVRLPLCFIIAGASATACSQK